MLNQITKFFIMAVLTVFLPLQAKDYRWTSLKYPVFTVKKTVGAYLRPSIDSKQHHVFKVGDVVYVASQAGQYYSVLKYKGNNKAEKLWVLKTALHRGLIRVKRPQNLNTKQQAQANLKINGSPAIKKQAPSKKVTSSRSQSSLKNTLPRKSVSRTPQQNKGSHTRFVIGLEPRFDLKKFGTNQYAFSLGIENWFMDEHAIGAMVNIAHSNSFWELSGGPSWNWRFLKLSPKFALQSTAIVFGEYFFNADRRFFSVSPSLALSAVVHISEKMSLRLSPIGVRWMFWNNEEVPRSLRYTPSLSLGLGF